MLKLLGQLLTLCGAINFSIAAALDPQMRWCIVPAGLCAGLFLRLIESRR